MLFGLVILVCLEASRLARLLLSADDLGMGAAEYVFLYCRFGPSPKIGLSDGQTVIKAGITFKLNLICRSQIVV